MSTKRGKTKTAMTKRNNPILNYPVFVYDSNFDIFNMTEEKKYKSTVLSGPLAQAGDRQTPRPPIVVVLGHIDHGKTTLLDSIRKTKVAEKEAGGITQHIGSYEIEKDGKKITFIDTPGHEAFSAMRARGAKVADLAVLVIDAGEGVKGQTKEAILYIKKAGLPTVIALNKIDKPEANPEKVKRELAKEDVLVESLGGKIPSIEISAKSGKHIEELLDLILLIAEMEDLRGSLNKPAEGVVIEGYLDAQRGATATLLIRDGTLKAGDIVGTNSTFGKVRTLESFQGKQIEKALPSMPTVVLGWENVPQVGEKFKIYSDTKSAQENIEKKAKKREGGQVFMVEPGKKVLNLILKTDVLGSLEAVSELLKSLPQDKILIRILKGEVGEIGEVDIKLASSAKAKILGFRVKINPIAKDLAENGRIRIMSFEVIYELVQSVRQLMEKIIEPEIIRKELGKVKALAIFRTDKNRQIIGGKVIEGEIVKGVSIEILRPNPADKKGEGEKVGQGRLINLQRNKKDIERCQKGDECGILYEGSAKIEEGDILKIYIEERRKGEL
jgi:translation initiation factor IF-2